MDEERIISLLSRVDERTIRIADDVEALKHAVFEGNGTPSLTAQVARLDERVAGGLESRAARWKTWGVAMTAGSGLLIALLGLLAKAC